MKIKHTATSLLVGAVAAVAAVSAPGVASAADAATDVPGAQVTQSRIALDLPTATTQAGIGMDAIVIYGCRRLGKTVVRGDDGQLYCV